MADSKSLRLGNVFNKVGSLGANTEEKSARSLALANTLSGVADTLSGKDYQPGMSGFEQALIAGARGAASGLQGKAAIEKAKGQDELNAFAKSLADDEMKRAKIEEIERKEQESIAQAAPAIATATIAFAEGRTDEQTYSATVENLVKNIMQTQGKEVLSVVKQGSDPFTYAVTVRDPETGEAETDIRNVGKEFGGVVLKMDAELGKAFIASAGRLPANYFQKQEKPTGKLADLQSAQQALGRELSESEKMQILGVKTGAETKSWDDRDKAVFKSLNERVEKLANYDDLQALSDAAATKLIDSGLDTGFGTDVLATVAGALGRAFGADNLTQFSGDVSALSSALREQVLPKVKALGAGTGISNADRDYAEKTVGSVNDTVESLIEKMALQRAIAEKGAEVKRLYQDASAGAGEFDGMNPGDANRLLQQKLAEIENRGLDDAKGLKALTARYQAQYLRQLYTKRGILPSGDTAMGTPIAQGAPQTDLTSMSDAELEAIAGGQ
jgi:hypothetical protein